MAITLDVITKLVESSVKDSSKQVETQLTKAGEKAGQGFTKSFSKSVSTSTDMQRAFDKAADSAGKLRVEEQKLKDLQDKGTGTRSQLIAQSEKVASAKRNEARDVKIAADAYEQFGIKAVNSLDVVNGRMSTMLNAFSNLAGGTRLGGIASSMAGIGTAAGEAGAALGTIGASAVATGIIAATGVGAIALAVGAVTKNLYDLGAEWDSVFDNIQIKTGATGPQLEALKNSTKNIAGSVPEDIGKIGDVVAQTSRSLHLTGTELDSVSESIANLGRLTGEDINVRKLGESFRMFGIDSTQMIPQLDSLLQASQTTGIGINELVTSAVNGGYQLKEFGFNFGQATSLITSLQEIGVDADSVMAPLTKALKNIAKEGGNPAQVLRQTIDQVKQLISLGKDDEAMTKVNDLFGGKGGLKIFEAIKNNALDVDTLNKSLGNTKTSITQLAADTDDFPQHWKNFTNALKSDLEPVSKAIFDTLDGGLVKLTDFLKGPMTQAESSMRMYEDAVRKAAEVTDGLANSVSTLKADGQNVTIDVSENTDEVKKALSDLGMHLEAMANDPTHLKIVPDTPEAQEKLEAFRRQQENLPLNIQLGIHYDAGKSFLPEWLKEIGGPGGTIQVPVSFIPTGPMPGTPTGGYGLAPSLTAPNPAATSGPPASKDPLAAIMPHATGGIAGRTSSGLLYGPGSGISDSIMGVDPITGMPTALVSNGEGIVTASAMQRPGVASFVSGLNRFAGGTSGVTPEINYTAGIASGFGLPLTSGRRNEPGSYHNSGEAGDFGNSPHLGPSTVEEDAFANFMAANFGPYLSELIHQSPNFHHNIKDGKDVGDFGPGQTYNEKQSGYHGDHVHVAFKPGALANLAKSGGDIKLQNGGVPVFMVGGKAAGATGAGGMSAGLGQVGAPLAGDMGISGGLPGMAQYATTLLANMAFAPLIGSLSAMSAANPIQGGSGLLGILGARNLAATGNVLGNIGPGPLGGGVVGPGTGTSDSIPAMLSNGEYVLPADTVNGMGGPGGVSSLVQGYAEGGPVTDMQSVPQSTQGGSGFQGLGGMPMQAITTAVAAAGPALDAIAPGASQAAQIGVQLANRTAAFAGQLAGIGVSGLLETFLPHGSPIADPGKSWLGKIASGFAGARPALPNTAGQQSPAGQPAPAQTPEQAAALNAQTTQPNAPMVNIEQMNNNTPDGGRTIADQVAWHGMVANGAGGPR